MTILDRLLCILISVLCALGCSWLLITAIGDHMPPRLHEAMPIIVGAISMAVCLYLCVLGGG